jgi:hypothetical protein
LRTDNPRRTRSCAETGIDKTKPNKTARNDATVNLNLIRQSFLPQKSQ